MWGGGGGYRVVWVDVEEGGYRVVGVAVGERGGKGW